MHTVHDDVTITSGWRHPWHAYCVRWRHYYIMLKSSLSGSGIRIGLTGIRIGSAHPGEEDACHAKGASARGDSHLSGAWGHVRRSISTPFSPVASSLPPLHSGMVKTPFWQLSFLSKKSNTTLNHKLQYQLLGIPAPLCADRWCSDSCPLEAKHTDTQYLTWFGKTAYIHGRSPYY